VEQDARSPLLTIALPTYNRADLLDRQLKWLADEVTGLDGRCEVLVSDNCSTDATPEVIERWSTAFGGIPVRHRRHRRNLGAVRNIFSCIEDAAGRFVWTISDDDPFDDGTVGFVLDQLSGSPDLELLVLNFSMRNVHSGELLYARCFELDDTVHADNGHRIFQELLRPRHPARWGGLVLTSALVYRSTTARAALRWWPEGYANLNTQLVVTGFCAQAGETIVTAEPHLECAGGDHHWMANDRRFFKFVVPDYAESFLKLSELGYDPRLCRRKILEQPTYVSRRLGARCATRYPAFTARATGRYLRALWRADRHARLGSLSPTSA
jgi:abequosyltransferase